MEPTKPAETKSTSTEPKPTVTAPAAALPVAPTITPNTTWPGAFGVWKTSKVAVMLNLATVVLIWAFSFAVSGLTNLLPKSAAAAGFIIGFVASAFFAVAYVKAYLAGVRGQKIEVVPVIQDSVPFAANMFLLNLLILLAVVGGLLLFIVPGIIIAIRLVLAAYFLVDQKLGAVDAFRASWQATKGHSSEVAGILLATMAMVLPALTIIGIPVAVYFVVLYGAATALFYEYLTKQAPVAATPVAPAAPVAA